MNRSFARSSESERERKRERKSEEARERERERPISRCVYLMSRLCFSLNFVRSRDTARARDRRRPTAADGLAMVQSTSVLVVGHISLGLLVGFSTSNHISLPQHSRRDAVSARSRGTEQGRSDRLNWSNTPIAGHRCWPAGTQWHGTEQRRMGGADGGMGTRQISLLNVSWQAKWARMKRRSCPSGRSAKLV